jgi:hypothetical protein
MIKIVSLTAVIFLTTGCAAMYDAQDPCQKTHLIATGQYPSWCGGGGAKYVTRDWRTNRALTTTKVEK